LRQRHLLISGASRALDLSDARNPPLTHRQEMGKPCN
jgi:hypothetical protein